MILPQLPAVLLLNFCALLCACAPQAGQPDLAEIAAPEAESATPAQAPDSSWPRSQGQARAGSFSQGGGNFGSGERSGNFGSGSLGGGGHSFGGGSGGGWGSHFGFDGRFGGGRR